MEKRCFKCNRVKSINEFYVHSQMSDGHLNKCKYCTRSTVRDRYYNPLSRLKIIDYERARWKRPERRLMALEYQRKRRKRFPGKNIARQRVGRAVKIGKIVKTPCEVCGETRVEAHHEDYRKYLQVRWLCRKHHLELENKIAY